MSPEGDDRASLTRKCPLKTSQVRFARVRPKSTSTHLEPFLDLDWIRGGSTASRFDFHLFRRGFEGWWVKVEVNACGDNPEPLAGFPRLRGGAQGKIRQI